MRQTSSLESRHSLWSQPPQRCCGCNAPLPRPLPPLTSIPEQQLDVHHHETSSTASHPIHGGLCAHIDRMRGPVQVQGWLGTGRQLGLAAAVQRGRCRVPLRNHPKTQLQIQSSFFKLFNRRPPAGHCRDRIVDRSWRCEPGSPSSRHLEHGHQPH